MMEEQNQKTAVLSAKVLHWAGTALVATVWISSGLFGLYILAFYAAALYQGNMERWNKILPELYAPDSGAASAGIGLHFAAGGIILILGSIQLISTVRKRYPAFHRWVGRLYVLSSVFAGLGGLTFIFIKGTIGGTVMDIGFTLYGVLMLICAEETYRHAVARRIDLHRAWALRLYALAIGSWLYRMDYGFWILLTDGWGHQDYFGGPFDKVMAFFFYLPNLLVAEVFIQAPKFKSLAVFNVLSAIFLLCINGFLLLGTYFFTKHYWGPAILEWFVL
ncbi:MAG TPA: DUF2306 domain-containing protein [Haliscomenobacter sp.]|uniref:DUF2306 domain-containing protein n=1 Tax=Haliscomenobacter sp. TaxID=2717303 RepID=UPI002CDEFE58|nr:DUF2306 domain-containing protein [Haliscomenobacter sp.]HOY16057.1 DUF2306 domain-containing protein [Haliscomenobacter sp.]HPH22160.1 DUF2306 domain-containing protein [Haliscomenobacter sp.]